MSVDLSADSLLQLQTTAAALAPALWKLILYALAAALLGALAGAAELISRYRDEPWHPFRILSGRLYVFSNAAVSLAVYGALILSGAAILPNLSPGWKVLVAGFGAMAILRSKFFTFRTSANEDVAVGIDAVVTTFLQAIDRNIDRQQSLERWKLAYGYLQDVDEQSSLEVLISLCKSNLRSYQGVTNEELDAFKSAAKELLDRKDMPVSLKAVTVGLALQAIVGSDNFSELAKEFRASQGLPPCPPDRGKNRGPARASASGTTAP